MPNTKITWSLTADIESDKGKDSYKFDKMELEVGAYDTVRVTVPRKTPDDNPLKVDVQPSCSGQIEFFLLNPMIKDKPKEPVKDLCYAFCPNATSSCKLEDRVQKADQEGKVILRHRRVPLKGLQLFTSGAALWFDDVPDKLYFWNCAEEDIDVLMVVGRQPTA